MIFFDAHCDILYKIKHPEELFSNTYHWDAQRALSNGPFIQVFSAFNESFPRNIAKIHMESQIESALQAERDFPDKIKLIRSKKDLKECCESLSKDRVYGILEAEGAEILGGSLKELKRLYNIGLRILTLVWNYDNDVCDSAAGQNPHNGLSAFGYNVVEEAEKLGIVIDVSHASDKTFDDVMNITKKPVIASHSNARAVCNHKRNLTDAQIKSIAARGGVIGINLYSDFLVNSGNARLLDIIKHIEHIAALAGTSCIGIGADFDGIDAMPQEITGVENLKDIIETLLRHNYSEDHVKAIAGGNFVRLMHQIL